jgi:hypothetical protein
MKYSFPLSQFNTKISWKFSLFKCFIWCFWKQKTWQYSSGFQTVWGAANFFRQDEILQFFYRNLLGCAAKNFCLFQGAASQKVWKPLQYSLFQLWIQYIEIQSFFIYIRSVNLRSGNIFVRPKLESEFKQKSLFWSFFLTALTESGPNYGEKTDLRPKD